MNTSNLKSRWGYAAGPALFIAFLALYPQMSLWIDRGSSWNGSYFITNYDEAAYSAYVNALVNGGSRRNDPFLGFEHADHESLYSIQFIPAYAVALPARVLGVSTSTAFIVLSALIAVATALALFWLIRTLTGDDMIAAAGTIIVLCLGTAAAFEGELRHLYSGLMIVDFFPFLRRYQPGLAFPVFLLFCGCSFKALANENRRTATMSALFAGVLFGILVFSYFYLWTAAIVFFGVYATLHFWLVTEHRWQTARSAVIVLIFAAAALVPYFVLLGNRDANIDEVQLLSQTHLPDLASPVVIIGLVVAVALIVLHWRRALELSGDVTLFALAAAVAPLILLNQQIVTGRSLQPIHYEIFVANYLVLLALVLTASIFVKDKQEAPLLRKAIAYAALAAAAWGIVEAATTVKRDFDLALVRDRSEPAVRLAEQDAALSHLSGPVLTPEIAIADFVPTLSSLRPVWNPHTSSAGGASVAENKHLFYLYLYYSGFTDKDLSGALREKVFEVTSAIFGTERALPELGANQNPITGADIDREAASYRQFASSFDAANADAPALGYIVVETAAQQDLSRVDRWYKRETVGEVGGFSVFRLTRK